MVDLMITSKTNAIMISLKFKNSRPRRTLYSKKYGVALIQYTHAPNTVIHASTKVDGKVDTLSIQRMFHDVKTTAAIG